MTVSKSNKRFVKNCLVLGQVQYFTKTQYSVTFLFILFTVFVQLLLFRDFAKKYNKFYNLWSISYIFFTSDILLIVKIILAFLYSGSYLVWIMGHWYREKPIDSSKQICFSYKVHHDYFWFGKQFDNVNRMITLSVISLNGFHCCWNVLSIPSSLNFNFILLKLVSIVFGTQNGRAHTPEESFLSVFLRLLQICFSLQCHGFCEALKNEKRNRWLR